MDKKGFTLIELLAVILILGVIALIAIPQVTRVIEQSRKGAFETTTSNIIRTVREDCTLKMMSGDPSTTYKFENGKVSPSLDVTGGLPKYGIVNTDSKCNVYANLSNETYTITKEYTDEKTTTSKVNKPLKDDRSITRYEMWCAPIDQEEFNIFVNDYVSNFPDFEDFWRGITNDGCIGIAFSGDTIKYVDDSYYYKGVIDEATTTNIKNALVSAYSVLRDSIFFETRGNRTYFSVRTSASPSSITTVLPEYINEVISSGRLTELIEY
ncbi:MAG: prepilin-type N-terminal cleavage/methylation domain-containing protein [Bacilli bacterium]|nr:prepilin-type N-terminal cleavage/methylation domain-containing protein [Bacilli bacterium]